MCCVLRWNNSEISLTQEKILTYGHTIVFTVCAEKRILLSTRKPGALNYWYNGSDLLVGPVREIVVSTTKSFFQRTGRGERGVYYFVKFSLRSHNTASRVFPFANNAEHERTLGKRELMFPRGSRKRGGKKSAVESVDSRVQLAMR